MKGAEVARRDNARFNFMDGEMARALGQGG